MFKYTLAATLDEMDREGMQAEYRADKAAVLKHIPYPELAARLRRGDTLADAAEYFCVTEDFLRKAYALYRDMGYSFGAEEKA